MPILALVLITLVVDWLQAGPSTIPITRQSLCPSMRAKAEELAARPGGDGRLINARQRADRQVGWLPIRRIETGGHFHGVIDRALGPSETQYSAVMIDGQRWHDRLHGYILGHVPVVNRTGG